MATLHRPTARWPSSSSAWVTIPTGLVKSTSHAPGLARAAISSASSRTIGTVRSALASPPAPVGLLAQAAVADRQRLVDVARRLAADAQLDHDEVGPLEGGVRVGRRGERPAPSPRPQDALGEPADDLAPLLARVEQDEIVDDHPVLDVAQAVDQLGGVRAPAADDDHLGAHAAQRNIRPCPSPCRCPRRPCLAFDGGSTKTDVVLVSRTGAVLGRARVGPSNHQLVGLDGTLDGADTKRSPRSLADAGDARRRGGSRSARPASTASPASTSPSTRRSSRRRSRRWDGPTA